MLNDKSYGKQKMDMIQKVRKLLYLKMTTRSRKISETANAGDGFFGKSQRSKYQSKLIAEQNLKPVKKNGRVSNSTFNVEANQELITISMLLQRKGKQFYQKP